MSATGTFQTFRKIAMLEGLSFLILLFMAMPLKYAADYPMAVTIVGSIHGALFIGYVVYMYRIYDLYDKSTRWMLMAFLASIIPFGTFIMDKKWREEARMNPEIK